MLHCTYSLWRLRPQTRGSAPGPHLGDCRSSDPLLSHYTPCHYILDKGLVLHFWPKLTHTAALSLCDS